MKNTPARASGGAETEVAVHLQRRESDVRSIEEVEDVRGRTGTASAAR
jgi:hypothetical protein